jgi:PII-like signaling protein
MPSHSSRSNDVRGARVLRHAEQLTIFVDGTDRYGRTPLYTELVRRARRAGMAGATVLHGVEGFGAASHLNVAHPAALSEKLPAVVVCVDQPDRIEAFVHEVDGLIADGLIVRQRVQIMADERATP